MRILNHLHEIDRIFAQKLHLQINYHRLRRLIVVTFLTWISICILGVSISVSVLIPFATVEEKLRIVLSLYSVLKQIVFGSTYITYAILVRHRIQAMHEILDKNSLLTQETAINISIDCKNPNEHEAFEFRRLIHLWRLFPLVYDAVQSINHTFKWSISMYIFVNVFNFCVVGFDYIRKIYESIDEDRKIIFFFSVPLLFYCMFLFGAIIQMANSVAKEADKIAPKIHRLSSSGTISDDLQHFVSRL